MESGLEIRIYLKDTSLASLLSFKPVLSLPLKPLLSFMGCQEIMQMLTEIFASTLSLEPVLSLLLIPCCPPALFLCNRGHDDGDTLDHFHFGARPLRDLYTTPFRQRS
jgi:hypothetical protein